MSLAPAAGNAAPDFEYVTASGASRHLGELWADGPALVIWLRHFG